MPAPSLAQLFNLPPNVEQALQSRMNAQINYCRTFIQRQPDDLPSERLQLQFVQGPALQHLRPMPDGTFRRDAWNYTLTVGVFTQRKEDDAGVHGRLRGMVADVVTAARYDAAFLPWYVLSTMGEMAVTESVQVGDDSDASQLQWTGMICIRPDAWPTS